MTSANWDIEAKVVSDRVVSIKAKNTSRIPRVLALTGKPRYHLFTLRALSSLQANPGETVEMEAEFDEPIDRSKEVVGVYGLEIEHAYTTSIIDIYAKEDTPAR